MARLIHGSMAGGIIAFAAGAYFAFKPATDANVSPVVVGAFLALSIVAAASSIVLRRRVPQRNTNESSDLFWTTASAAALLTWAALEAGAMLAIVAYLLGKVPVALIVAGIALAGLIALHPGRLERS
jgi:HD-like signal output (HDOD) protein